MNLNWWIVFDYICREINLKTFTLQKSCFCAYTYHQCFACYARTIRQISFILVHDLEDLSVSSLSPRKLVKVKSWKEKNVCHPYKFESLKLGGVKKKIAGARFCHLFQKF